MSNHLKYWLAFSCFEKIGPINFQHLYRYFPDIQQAWKAGSGELIKAGLERNIVQEFIEARKQIDPDYELDRINKKRIGLITLEDKEYPQLLKEIYNPPFLLYYKGSLLEEEIRLAVVGSRKFSNYGKNVVFDIVKDLASNNIVIVSGLAMGIDSLAHLATLKAKGRTIAVLGSGLNNIYPRFNIKLAEKIINSFGLVLTEYPLDAAPLKQHFPQRNRIIAGLSLGTLVIEAAKSSGAIITALQALEQNKEVMSVPGSIYNLTSEGTNNLIKWGARPVTKAQDVLDALHLQKIEEEKE